MKSHRATKSLSATGALVTVLAALSVFMLGAQPAQATTRVEVKQIVVEEANNSRVPPSLALAVAKVESDFQAKALSPAGARGVMQIMPATARGEYGVNPDETWDARLNIQLGVDFLDRLIERYGGRWDLALSHYNGGSVRGTMPNAEVLPATRKYVEAVLKWQKRYAEQATVWFADGRAANDDPADGWRSARTRVVATADSVDRTLDRLPGSGVKVVWTSDTGVETSVWTVPTWSLTATGSLDDFDDGMAVRVLLARGQLDDYSPVINWTSE
ncbi:MAG: lytic transglycosylase domain-containing protein [Alphaproteobacteria bacterium]